MPPSLSVSVGVPPATVTTSLMASVSVMTAPVSSRPLGGEVAIAATLGPFDER